MKGLNFFIAFIFCVIFDVIHEYVFGNEINFYDMFILWIVLAIFLNQWNEDE